jgi:hypothetical protein
MENRKKLQEEQCEKSRYFFDKFKDEFKLESFLTLVPPRQKRFFSHQFNLISKDGNEIPVIVKASFGKKYDNNDENLKKKIRENYGKGKVLPEQKCYSFYGFNYEMKIYEKVIPKIIYYSPNFVLGYVLSYKKNDMNENNKNMYNIFNEELQKLKMESKKSISIEDRLNLLGCDEDEVHILISEFVEDFREDYKEKGEEFKYSGYYHIRQVVDLNEDDFRKVVIQIILTLAIMSLFKFSNNDLHLNNIRIKKEKPIDLHYYFGKEIYLTIPKVEYKVYFFDWDRAYAEELGDNIELEFICETILSCNGYYLISDIVKVLYHLKQQLNSPARLAQNPGTYDQNIFIKFFKRVFPNLGNNSPFPGNQPFGSIDNMYKVMNKPFFEDEDNPTMFFTRIFKDPYIKDILV